jgi:hypothetical protein
LLQETWLLESDLPILTQVDANFYAKGITSMKTNNNIILGRPFGGLAILWRKSLGSQCNVLTYEDDCRLMSIDINCSGIKYTLVNVYLPYCSPEYHDEFLAYLSKIESLITSADTPYVYAIGDFNADLNKDHRFGNELSQFCHDMDLTISDKVHLQDCYTFVSCAHNSTAWLDHVICSASAHSLLNSFQVHYDKITSDHLPLSFSVHTGSAQCTPPQDSTSASSTVRCVQWDKLTPKEIKSYTECSDMALSSINFEHELVLCQDVTCTDPSHISAVNRLQVSICDALLTASECLQKPPTRGYKQVPGWADCCKDTHAHAREVFLLWHSHGSPRQGPIFSEMKRSHAQFKLTLRQCKLNSEQKSIDFLAKKFLSKDTKTFWKAIKTLNNSHINPVASTISGVSGEDNICKLWHDHFKGILNSCTDFSRKESMCNRLKDVKMVDLLCPLDVKSAVLKLKKGKSAGMDNITSEHFLYANEKLCVLLCMLFNAMLIHNHIPSNLMDTMLIPLLKDKKGDITDRDNYRPIALTCIMSKVLEVAILYKYYDSLQTSDYQFGFKPQHGTDQCIFALKEVIDLYTASSSPVYVCFMDASKAFDRVNHFILCDKLLDRGIPVIVTRLLYTWFSTQTFYVKWVNSVSPAFMVLNGVRQGGILSPILFNVFMDDLSYELLNTNVGCCVDDILVNHLFYADDSVLMAPSPSALQRLISTCESYAKAHDIIYNFKKSFCMSFLPKDLKKCNVPDMFLLGKPLGVVKEYKYLGVVITDDKLDHRDIMRQIRAIYTRGNILLRKFRKCTDEVKLQLFKSYCTNL